MTKPNSSDFLFAAKESFPVGMGYIPLGTAFGLFAVSQGFHWWWATVTAALVYAGSLEFLLVNMMLGAASLVSVATTAFFVNFRHIFYGLSFPTRNVRSSIGRLYSVHALTDEAYALLSRPQAQSYSGPKILWTQIMCQLYWVGGVTFGALAGSWIPFDLSWLEFTLVALFAVLSIDVVKNVSKPIHLSIIALLCGGLALLLAPDYLLVAAMTAYAVIVVAGRRWLL